MPFYEYQCSHCDHLFEAMQKISEAPLRKCPSCGRNMLKKLLSAPVFRLKGSGWYETDFKSDQERKRNLAGGDRDSPESSSATDAKDAKDAKSKGESETGGKGETGAQGETSGKGESSAKGETSGKTNAETTAAGKTEAKAAGQGKADAAPAKAGQSSGSGAGSPGAGGRTSPSPAASGSSTRRTVSRPAKRTAVAAKRSTRTRSGRSGPVKGRR